MRKQTYSAAGIFFLIVFIGPSVGAADDGSGHPYGARGAPSATPRSPGTAPAPERPAAAAQKAADKVQTATQAYMQAKTILMISSDNPAGNDSKKAVAAANKAAAAYNELVKAREAAGAQAVAEAAKVAAKAGAAQAKTASQEAAVKAKAAAATAATAAKEAAAKAKVDEKAKATTPSTTIGAGGLDWNTLEERPPGSGMWYKKVAAIEAPATKSVASMKNADAKQKAAQVKAAAEEKAQFAKVAAEKARAAAKEAVAKAEAEKKKASSSVNNNPTMADIIAKIVASHADGNNAIHSGPESPMRTGAAVAIAPTKTAELQQAQQIPRRSPQPDPPLDAKAEAQYQANRAEYIRVNGSLPPTGHSAALAAGVAAVPHQATAHNADNKLQALGYKNISQIELDHLTQLQKHTSEALQSVAQKIAMIHKTKLGASDKKGMAAFANQPHIILEPVFGGKSVYVRSIGEPNFGAATAALQAARDNENRLLHPRPSPAFVVPQ